MEKSLKQLLTEYNLDVMIIKWESTWNFGTYGVCPKASRASGLHCCLRDSEIKLFGMIRNICLRYTCQNYKMGVTKNMHKK